MGMFSSILGKLGVNNDEVIAPDVMPYTGKPAPTAAATVAQTTVASTAPETPAPTAVVAQPKPTVTPVATVDVVAQLEELAEANPEKLNWKASIVDLLKLLNLDSSLTARKELATELACPAAKMTDSAQMNLWLHKTVLQKLAQNGGNIPADLLD